MRLSTIIISTAFVLAGTSTAIPVERKNMLVARFGDSDFLAKVEARAYDKGIQERVSSKTVTPALSRRQPNPGDRAASSETHGQASHTQPSRSQTTQSLEGNRETRQPLQNRLHMIIQRVIGRHPPVSPPTRPVDSETTSVPNHPLHRTGSADSGTTLVSSLVDPETILSPSLHRTRSADSGTTLVSLVDPETTFPPSLHRTRPSTPQLESFLSLSSSPSSSTRPSSSSSHSPSSGTGPVDSGTTSHHPRSLYEPSEISRRSDRPWTRYGYSG